MTQKTTNFLSSFLNLKYLSFIILLALNLSLIYVSFNWDKIWRDSGVFLYIGNQILQGKIPYKDVWDHKPPLVYYIDALALILPFRFPHNLFTVESLFSLTTTTILFRLLLKKYNLWIAFVSSLIFNLFLYPTLYQRGNLTESYALLFQVSILYLFFLPPKTLHFIGIGLLGGLLFLTKQNLIGVFLTSVVLVALAQRKYLLPLLIGFLVPLFFVSSYFIVHGSWIDFIQAAFRFNFYYSRTGLSEKFISVQEGYRIFSQSRLSYLAFIGYVFTLFRLFNPSKNKNLNCLFFLCLGPLVEIALSAVSGKSYAHYYISWLPLFSLLTAQGLSFLVKIIRSHLPIFSLISLVVCTLVTLQILARTIITIRDYSPTFRQPSEATLIRQEMSIDDSVFIWGAESSLYFLLDQKAPNKYVYQYPLFTPGFAQEEMFTLMLQSLRKDPPALLIDATSTQDLIPTINCRQPFYHCRQSQACHQLYQYFCNNYTYYQTQPNGWILYTLTKPVNTQNE